VFCEKGKTILLWKDTRDNMVRGGSYPHLYSFAKNYNLTVENPTEADDEKYI
jgi:hypothetical protein